MTQPTVSPRGDDPPRSPRTGSGGNGERSRRPVAWSIAAVLLAIGVVGTLIVPVYARVTPKAGSFPFFYWYQLVWIPLVAILSWACYLIAGRSSRRGQSGPDDGERGRRDEQR